MKAGATKKYGQTITQNFPATLFKEELQNAWGLGNFPGRNVQVIEEGNVGKPCDTDGCRGSDVQELASDHEGSADLLRSGNSTAITADTNSDGTLSI